MDELRAGRLVEATLRCYPARWRQRHGVEAAELAALLIGDGASVSSIVWSYLTGAAREWLTPRPSRRLSAVACGALATACSLGVTGTLLLSTSPATAATSPSQAPAHCRPGSTQPSPKATPANSRPQVVISEAGHGRSC